MKTYYKVMTFVFISLSSNNFAQISLENITNYCQNYSSPEPGANLHNLIETNNFIIYRSGAQCNPGTLPPKFSLFAFDGTNNPYLLKFPDNTDVINNDNYYGGYDLVNLNNRIYLNIQSSDTSKNGLYYFDENISTTKITKVNTSNFPQGCQDFSNLVKLNNGIVYEDFNNNCFYNPTNGTSNLIFYGSRYSNFFPVGHYFGNIEYNNNLLYVLSEPGEPNCLNKYDPISNTSECIVNGVSSTDKRFPINLMKFSNKVYFINRTNLNGTEIFYYDGFQVQCLDINPGSGSSNPNLLTIMNNNLYFTSFYNNTYYIYKYDGLSSPKIIHQSSYTYPYTTYYSGLCSHENKLYFSKTYNNTSSNVYNTDLYSYNENDSNASLIQTFNGFQTESVWDVSNEILNYDAIGLPQFEENKRGNLFSFKGNLYIFGTQMLTNSTYNSADQDIWKVKNLNLSTSEIYKNKVNYYPNPVIDNLSINFEKSYSLIELEIYNNSGNFLSKHTYYNAKNIKIKLPNQIGIYYIKTTINKKDIYIEKILKK